MADAFRNIPVAVHQRWLLGFQWNGHFYRECCLPFGLSTAPFLFNLFAEGLHWILQSWLQWCHLEHFLDDFIYIVPENQASLPQLRKINAEYNTVTDVLGVPRNDKKDCTGTIIEVLGILVNTHKFEASLSQEKLTRALNATAEALRHESVCLYNIQSLAGYLSFCSLVVRLGWVFMRRIWSFIATFPPGASKHLRRRMPASVREDILWWHTLLPQFNGVLFFTGQNRPTVYLYTDASGAGSGAFFYKDLQNRFWPEVPTTLILQHHAYAKHAKSTLPQAPFDINVSEVYAILTAFELWSSQWRKHRVLVNTDSVVAYRGLRKNTLSGPANTPLRKILLIAASNDILIQPRWIEGTANTLADALSRFDTIRLANLCPHWQDSLHSMNPPPHG